MQRKASDRTNGEVVRFSQDGNISSWAKERTMEVGITASYIVGSILQLMVPPLSSWPLLDALGSGPCLRGTVKQILASIQVN